MINNIQYKIFALQIARLFCADSQNKSICETSIKTKIINAFNDSTFEHFLEHLQQGRYYLLKYSNWHSDANDCRSMKVDVRLTDVITGNVVNGYWHYTAVDCGSKQYLISDLNYLPGRNGYTLLDDPIMTKTNSDITKERLVYNSKAQPYGITYVPSSGQQQGQIIPSQGTLLTVPEPNMQVKQNGFDIKSLFDNPILLIGVGILAFFFLVKK